MLLKTAWLVSLKKQLPTVRAISISFVNEQPDNSGINGETPAQTFETTLLHFTSYINPRIGIIIIQW